MKCPNIEKLNNYANGILPSEEIITISEHISGCDKCRSYIMQQTAFKKPVHKLADNLLSLEDCPEYEVLSAYVSDEITGKEKAGILTHINSCELCHTDIEHIKELRAASLLRGVVSLEPQQKKPVYDGWILSWKSALAAAAVFAMVLFSISTDNPIYLTSPIASVEKAPQINLRANARVSTDNKTRTIAANPVLIKPDYKILAKDGKSVVVKKQGRVIIASAKNPEKPLRLNNLIFRFVSDKLRFGKVDVIESVNLAAANVFVRSGDSSGNSISAPKLLSPVKELVVSDKPLFEWSANDLAYEYKILVTDKTGKAVLEQTTSKNGFKAVNRLDRGTLYQWRIGIRFGAEDEFTYSKPTTFRIVSNQASRDIKEAEQTGSHLVLGSVYEAYGLSSKAKEEYKLFNSQNPKSSLLNKGR